MPPRSPFTSWSDQVEPDPSSLAAKVSTAPPRKSPLFPTSAGDREAPVYHDLATKAHEAGFPDVSPSQVHEWVMAGLLPPTARQVSLGGNRGFRTERLPGVEEQLIALCRLRHQTKSHDRLALLLWLDGWPIDSARVRDAVVAWLPQIPTRGSLTDHFLDALDEIARRRGPTMLKRLAVGRIGPRQAANGTYAALSLGLLDAELDEEGAFAIEHIARLHRARSDALEGVGPWLTGPPEASLNEIARAGGLQALRATVEAASETDVEAAQRRVRALVVEFPRMVHLMELSYGRDFAGWGLAGRLAQAFPEVVTAIVLWFPKLGLTDAMDAFADVLAKNAEDLPRWIELGEEYVERHPDQRRPIDRDGLIALDKRGELEPLDPATVARLLGPAGTGNKMGPPKHRRRCPGGPTATFRRAAPTHRQ